MCVCGTLISTWHHCRDLGPIHATHPALRARCCTLMSKQEVQVAGALFDVVSEFQQCSHECSIVQHNSCPDTSFENYLTSVPREGTKIREANWGPDNGLKCFSP